LGNEYLRLLRFQGGPARYLRVLLRGRIAERRVLHPGGLAPRHRTECQSLLRRSIQGFDRYLAAGQIEIVRGPEWYLKGEEFDMQRITGGWHAKLSGALDKGYAGMRVSGNAFWIEGNHWKQFCEYSIIRWSAKG
jgi:MEDS: MEthanogen/methylotroph, DcmR Sensory domain